MAVVRRIDDGQRLFARGAAADGLYSVLAGAVRVSVVADSGKEAIVNLFEAPHWFGEIALFDGERRTHDAHGVGDTTLLHLPQAPLLALLQREPAYWQDLGRLLTHKIRHLLTLFDDAVLQPAEVRLARRLLAFFDGYGHAPGAVASIRLGQESLGQMIGATRQTVNLILRQFEAEGIVDLGRGDIRLLDEDALRRKVPSVP
ncbi:Crp/Fnr family transcriptional regulator [Denitratisoma sp. agr-D3]